MVQQYSARDWAQRQRGCCAEAVETTVQIEQTDIDTENYQSKTGPPSTSQLPTKSW